MTLSQDDIRQLTGSRARLWDFSPSHDHLVVKIMSESGDGQFLVLSGCEEISLPVFWQLKRPRLVTAGTTGRRFLEFTDDGVRALCQDASIHSDYKRTA